MPESVAGRRLQALCRPHPQNGRPASSKLVAVRPLPKVKSITKSICSANNQKKGALYCITARGKSRVKVHQGNMAKQAKSAYRRFRFADVG
ncbi:hypothetical protein [Xenorhabdus indica]|uniref:hypothetical protein n=1 Tax=Xenorhabdus indica TaxID=333964 RepID=UPI0016572B0B|nr:hypothetical protein [Xenorhabdus indica]